MEQSRIDWPSFGLCAAILISASILLFAFPDASNRALEALYKFIASETEATPMTKTGSAMLWSFQTQAIAAKECPRRWLI